MAYLTHAMMALQQCAAECGIEHGSATAESGVASLLTACKNARVFLPRRALVALVFVAAGFLSPGARADVPPVAEDMRRVNNRLGFAAMARHFSYAEANSGMAPGLPDTLDRESGFVPGVVVEGSVEQKVVLPNVYLEATLGLFQGDVSYDGLTQTTHAPLRARNSATIKELGVAAGVGIPLGRRVALTPLVRYGYRNWIRAIVAAVNGTTTNQREDYSHHELDAGALFQIVMVRGLVFGLDGAVGYTISPAIEIGFVGPLTGVTLPRDLGNAPVLRGGMTLGYAFTDVLQGFVRYRTKLFWYGKSDVAAIAGIALLEPASSTFENDFGVGLSVNFR